MLSEVDGAGWERFRTDRDPLGTNHLAAQNPEMVRELDQRS